MSVKATDRLIDKRRSIYAEPLSMAAKFLWLYLADRANAGNTCYPGRERIAADLSTSVSAVGRALSELVKVGLIVVESNASQARTNLYYVYSPDRRATEVGHTDLLPSPDDALKGHTDRVERSHSTFIVGLCDPQSLKVEVSKKEAAAAAPASSHNSKRPRESEKIVRGLPSFRITFDPDPGTFRGIDASDRARWTMLAPDADLDYELVKAADHALNVYERDPVKNAALFLSNWMKGAQRRIAEGRQPKGASRAPVTAAVNGPTGMLAL